MKEKNSEKAEINKKKGGQEEEESRQRRGKIIERRELSREEVKGDSRKLLLRDWAFLFSCREALGTVRPAWRPGTYHGRPFRDRTSWRPKPPLLGLRRVSQKWQN